MLENIIDEKNIEGVKALLEKSEKCVILKKKKNVFQSVFFFKKIEWKTNTKKKC